jgi:peptidoglycan hydrolase-like protein with peptidoglycan-binding domain
MKKFLIVALIAMAFIAGSVDAAYVGVLTKNLKKGMSDAEVTILQQGLAQDAAVYPEGLVTGYFGSLTNAAVIRFQEKYASEVLAPVGLTSGTGFVGAYTRAKFNALYGVASPTPTPSATPSATPTATPGVEGTITVTLEGVPSNGTDVYAGTSDTAIEAIKVKAASSDMSVQRMYVNFSSRIYLYASAISLWDGSQQIASVVPSSATVEEVTAGSDYRILFSGFNVVIAKDAYKVLTIKISLLSAPTSGAAWSAVSDETVTVKQNAVRAVDGKGINQYGPDANLSGRTFDYNGTDTATIEILSNSTSPAERVLQVSSTTQTTGVTALVFDLKAKDNSALLEKVEVDLTSGSQTLDGMVANAMLYQGSTLLAATSSIPAATTGELVFNLTSPYVTLSKDVATTFTVKLDLNVITGSEIGDYIYASIDDGASDFTCETVGTYAAVATYSGTVTGKKFYPYQNFPSLALVSVTGPTIDPNTSTRASATMRVSVTATGADIYVPKQATSSIYGLAVGTTAQAMSTSTVVVGTIDSGTNNYIVRSGQTATFDVSVVMNNIGGSAGFKKSWIWKFEWSTGDVATGWTSWTDKLGLGESASVVDEATIKTGDIYLQN